MNQPDAGVDTSAIETPDDWQGYTQDNYHYNDNARIEMIYWYDGGNSGESYGMEDIEIILRKPELNPGTDSSSDPEPTPDQNQLQTRTNPRADTNPRSGIRIQPHLQIPVEAQKVMLAEQQKMEIREELRFMPGFFFG